MKLVSIPAYLAAACATLALSGCVVAPVGYEPGYGGQAYGGPAYSTPPGVVYVAPTYAVPAPGYAWRYHARYGWGWHHPGRGWHRGWR
jgi:hypothetical protein